MIVVGYQGIGKSTLAGRDYKYIDSNTKMQYNVYRKKKEEKIWKF